MVALVCLEIPSGLFFVQNFNLENKLYKCFLSMSKLVLLMLCNMHYIANFVNFLIIEFYSLPFLFRMSNN